MGPRYRAPDWMQISPVAGGLFHERTQAWMLGVGRFGSILGSYVGGALPGLSWTFSSILALLAIPATLAALSILAAFRR